MSKDNKANLRANHGQHSDKQQRKHNSRSFIGFMSIIACLIMLLLITSCQPKQAQTFTALEVISHD